MTCDTCTTPKCCKNLGHCDAADKIESLLEVIEELEAELTREGDNGRTTDYSGHADR